MKTVSMDAIKKIVIRQFAKVINNKYNVARLPKSLYPLQLITND